MDVYSVIWQGDEGVARIPGGWWPPELSDRALLPDWKTPTFVLDGAFVDLQQNDAGVLIFSAYMRELIDRHKSSLDRIEWLPVRVDRGGDVREYAMLHFLEEMDVIDRKRSLLNRVNGRVIRAHLRWEAVQGHQVFTYSRTAGLIVLVTGEVFEAVRNCTGCYFAKIKVSKADARG